MIYFIYGNSPTIEFETEKITSEISKQLEGISPVFFDCSQKEEENFIETIQVNSIFSTTDFLILKRAELLKSSGIQKLFKSMKNFNLDRKEIIITYNVPIQYNKVVSEYELTKATIKNIEELANFKNFLVLNSENLVLDYIKKKLTINKNDSKQLAELLGDDYYHIKNEVDKIVTFLDGEEFSLDKIKNIVSFDKEHNLKELIDNFFKDFDCKPILDFLEKNKDMYLAFLYAFSEELIIFLKLSSLINDGKISKSMNYNVFKEIYEDFSDIFIGRNFKVSHPYTVYLKLSNFPYNFNINFLEEKLKELLYIEYFMKSGEKDIDIEVELFLKCFIK